MSGPPVRRRGRKVPAFPAYERLQQGQGDASLQTILAENPMLRFAVVQEINRGSVVVVDVDVDPASGVLTDLRLRLRGRTESDGAGGSHTDTIGVRRRGDAASSSRNTPGAEGGEA